MNLSVATLIRAATLSVLLLVPASAPAIAPAGRYTATGGVVHDTKTGLYWQQAVAPTKYTLTNALTYCSNNVAALPGTGWHLPAIRELQTLVDDSVAPPGPTIDTSVFPSTPAAFFWSSTPYAASATYYAWYVTFDYGLSHVATTTNTNNVRCVR